MNTDEFRAAPAPLEELDATTGGPGTLACSDDMLLEALAACAGVTLGTVATSIGVPSVAAPCTSKGTSILGGTLAVARDVPVGLRATRLSIELDTDTSDERIETLLP
jgi:hypothetical protein